MREEGLLLYCLMNLEAFFQKLQNDTVQQTRRKSPPT